MMDSNGPAPPSLPLPYEEEQMYDDDNDSDDLDGGDIMGAPMSPSTYKKHGGVQDARYSGVDTTEVESTVAPSESNRDYDDTSSVLTDTPWIPVQGDESQSTEVPGDGRLVCGPDGQTFRWPVAIRGAESCKFKYP